MVRKRFLQEQNNNDIAEMSHKKSDQKSESLQILRMRDLIKKTGMSRSFLYEKLRKKSKNYDPLSPPRIFMGGKSVGFSEAACNKWLISLAEKSLLNMGDSV